MPKQRFSFFTKDKYWQQSMSDSDAQDSFIERINEVLRDFESIEDFSVAFNVAGELCWNKTIDDDLPTVRPILTVAKLGQLCDSSFRLPARRNLAR